MIIICVFSSAVSRVGKFIFLIICIISSSIISSDFSSSVSSAALLKLYILSAAPSAGPSAVLAKLYFSSSAVNDHHQQRHQQLILIICVVMHTTLTMEGSSWLQKASKRDFDPTSSYIIILRVMGVLYDVYPLIICQNDMNMLSGVLNHHGHPFTIALGYVSLYDHLDFIIYLQ